MADRAERSAARRQRRWLAEQQQQQASRNQASRNQEIEIEFGEAENNPSNDDTEETKIKYDRENNIEETKDAEDSNDDASSEDTSSEETPDTDDSDEESSSSSSESSWSDNNGGSNNSKMGYSKVPKLPCDGEVNFEGWYRKFLTHASSRKYLTMVSPKAHTDLPPKGELTEYNDMNKAQNKALKAHSKALNDLHIAFEDNPAGEAIIEKSKIDRDRSLEHNAKITLQWPRGQVHHIFEELFKLYRKITPADRLQLKEDLRSITMRLTENPKGVFQGLFKVIQRYQYKTIKPTPDDLYATSKDLSMLWQEDASPFAIIEKMETSRGPIQQYGG